MKIIFFIAKTWIGACASGRKGGRFYSYPTPRFYTIREPAAGPGLFLWNGTSIRE
jgi:hypothetical protein